MSLSQADLMLMDMGELKKLAERSGVKVANQSREQLLEAIQLKAIRTEEDLRRRVQAEKTTAALAKLGLDAKSKKRPPAENVAIIASKKVQVKFLNRESPSTSDEPGDDISFNKGGFHFHLYDDKDHILPECLIVEDIEEIPEVLARVTEFFSVLPGMNAQKAKDTAKGVLERLSLPISCQNPVYGMKTLPSGEQLSVIVGWRRRFEFIRRNVEVPKDAEFGAVESEVLTHA